jgi:hypothetical protein
MTTSIAPSSEKTGVTPRTTLAALALYAHHLGPDGNHIRTGMIAQVLAEAYRLHPADAIRLAEEGYDDRVKAAGRYVNALIVRAVEL